MKKNKKYQCQGCGGTLVSGKSGWKHRDKSFRDFCTGPCEPLI